MTRRRLAALLVATVALAGAVACSGSEQRPTTPTTTAVGTTDGTNSPQAYPVYSDPGTPIYVAVGARFGLLLVAQPSAGARWVITDPPNRDILLSLGTAFVTDTTVMAGSNTSQILSFVAAAEGHATIGVTYLDAAGSPVEGASKQTFDVTVTADGTPPTTAPPVETTVASG